MIDMPYLLWDTASGCHGNCISCLGAPQAVASLAQSNVTSHIFFVFEPEIEFLWRLVLLERVDHQR